MADNKHSGKSLTYLSFISVVAMVLITVISAIAFRSLISSSAKTAEIAETKYYKYHYALVASDYTDPFWESVWRSANDAARAGDAYVEWVGRELSEGFTEAQLMRIAIDCSVDGILLKPDDTDEMTALINEAVSGGIPVITLMTDSLGSERQGYVGCNSYDLGIAYGEQLIDSLDDYSEQKSDAFAEPVQDEQGAQMTPQGAETQPVRVVLLFDEEFKSGDQNIIYSGILEALDKREDTAQNVEVTVVNIKGDNVFSADEAIREIIMNREMIPDVLICLNATDTLCAYHAVVDYNRVGQLRILGYYDSDEILNAVKKKIITSSVTVDAAGIGVNGFSALNECVLFGRTSDYAVAGLNVINESNVDEYIASRSREAE